jgi:hypothetical protein
LETGSNISGSTTVDAQNEGSEQTEGGKDGDKQEAGEEGKDDAEKPPELPIEVRSKLRRLDKIESRYHGMKPAAWYGSLHADTR